MAVLLKEMQADAPADSPLDQDINLLRQQVDVCKSRLQNLVSNADRRRMAEPEVLDAEVWLAGLSSAG
ncbi:hypothetical protein HSBAA_31610 [Vreelandella sulfidaeris]|uniref:Uncharacterized protein n=1 Tax=Vreelandella sulfidaeris TaxID=115553 RepID=A0A455U7C3_9GAMM|nr:hypothetical protein HSBAA_31610 [Halomonas sulfidaeris]